MAMLIDDTVGNFDFYSGGGGETTSTISSSSSEGRNWGDWSPLVDWDALRGGNEDFHDLIDSLIDHGAGAGAGYIHSDGYSNSLSPDTDMMTIDADEEPATEDSKGLRLVHLLMAAAEALAGANKSRDLAKVILVRLKELASPADGSNMERLAAYFTDALYSLLEGTGGSHGKRVVLHTGGGGLLYNRDPDVLAAFQLLQDMSPYVKFGHFTANQAILEAVVNDRKVHILDYDIMEGIQWPSLMQALVSRKDNSPPPTHLRITAISHGGSARRSIGTVQETGRRLVSFAASIGLPFSFHQCRLDSEEGFRPSSVKLVKGEALVVNCMLHLPHFNYRSSKSVGSFLSGAKTLNPKLMTMVEEEMGSGGGGGDGGFVGRFVDSLHYYSALYDSLEAGLLPVRGQSASRALVERVFMGPRIVAAVARIYKSGCEGEEVEEGSSGSGSWLLGIGYKPVCFSFSNHCQAKLLLGLFNDGYGVEELAKNRIALGWKSRRLLSASIWTSSSYT
ncbi:protein NODULATION SIGNALING PATHWAY 2-like [Impatiens glandulifera]|uniref:protein NODULATION SIGNALING PATHWAY 2-like n=1 Tax=Impatiens glandulifera TaxID=253017 RepID=UPI001FB12024|nr:protein NODULATION SIGNALING PATHWAY 2-like [Impatiens glandulifera]